MSVGNLVFEIGTEELPAVELHNVTPKLSNIVKNKIDKSFKYVDINVFTTPRRILIKISDIPQKVEGENLEIKGPKASIAYKDDKPTPAAIGFAKKNNVDVEDLYISNVKNVDYVFAKKIIPQKDILDILSGTIINIISNIPWKKTQRWGNCQVEFARPIRWIFAMYKDRVVDFEYAGIKSSNYTFGHKFLNPQNLDINNADDIIPALRCANVVLCENERKELITTQIKNIELQLNLKCKIDLTTLCEVVNLVEKPTCLVGEFDDSFLNIPKEIIIDALLTHQRYFPLLDKNDNLTNKFIIVSNGDKNYADNIVNGNERVVAARLFDARFFWDEDRKHPLEYYLENLKNVVYHEKLGTTYMKSKRIATLSKYVSICANCSDEIQNLSYRAGLLCKADLVTNAVVEFSSLQGVMGQYYAQESGEDERVSKAIGQHYWPKFAGDNIPESQVGKSCAIADKIDSIVGMFCIDVIPTGSSDPFALRRSALGILAILDTDFKFNLLDVIKKSIELYSEFIKFDSNKVLNDVLNFIMTRTYVKLKGENVDYDIIDAVSSLNIKDPLDFTNRCRSLQNVRNNKQEALDDLISAYFRAYSLSDKKLAYDVNTSILGQHERDLYDSLIKLDECVNSFIKHNQYGECIVCISKIKDKVDLFFDNVMIMDDDKEISENRIKLLNLFINITNKVADFSKITKTN